ncbi:unnamed protein product [Soboliphyme baturini]|uniref:Carboxypeptidase inhibitor n=1 Tax=Soboliphyme baturini TaxID=241478 RepID=A0A183IK77_9BILA|nr:unnamed protein product [Soboliphyme baturini]
MLIVAGFRCPFRRARKSKRVRCSIDLATNSSKCGSNFFCSPFDAYPPPDANVTSIEGICCRLPRLFCPYGKQIPLPKGKPCGKACTKSSVNGYCYWIPEMKIGRPICCPKPCPDGLYFSRGKCRAS